VFEFEIVGNSLSWFEMLDAEQTIHLKPTQTKSNHLQQLQTTSNNIKKHNGLHRIQYDPDRHAGAGI
jgi:hypothetical protein